MGKFKLSFLDIIMIVLTKGLWILWVILFNEVDDDPPQINNLDKGERP
jgi:hypothetical protein